jgi:hypothetical protein
MDPEVAKIIPQSSLPRNINAPGDKSIEVEHAHSISANEGHNMQCKITKEILRRRMLEEEDEDGEKENESRACKQMKHDRQVEDHLFKWQPNQGDAHIRHQIGKAKEVLNMRSMHKIHLLFPLRQGKLKDVLERSAFLWLN